jgi:hypothetical protein
MDELRELHLGIPEPPGAVSVSAQRRTAVEAEVARATNSWSRFADRAGSASHCCGEAVGGQGHFPRSDPRKRDPSQNGRIGHHRPVIGVGDGAAAVGGLDVPPPPETETGLPGRVVIHAMVRPGTNSGTVFSVW